MNNLIEQAVKHFDKKREQVIGWEDALQAVELCAKMFPELFVGLLGCLVLLIWILVDMHRTLR